MKKLIAVISALVCILALDGCSNELAENRPKQDEQVSDTTDIEQEALTLNVDFTPQVFISSLDNLPNALATADDITGEGGYLLLGELPEQDIALYCDNLEERNYVYIRHGDTIQTFDQKVWTDTAILPELNWEDWDEDGNEELEVKYLRHQGTYFDGQTSMPGVVCESVVYKWDGERWNDIHFSSGGPIQRVE